MSVLSLLGFLRRNLVLLAGAALALSWAARMIIPSGIGTDVGPVVLQTSIPQPHLVAADQALAVPTPGSLSAAHAALRRSAASEGPVVDALGRGDLWLMDHTWVLLRLAVAQAESWFRLTYLPSLSQRGQP